MSVKELTNSYTSNSHLEYNRIIKRSSETFKATDADTSIDNMIQIYADIWNMVGWRVIHVYIIMYNSYIYEMS